MSPIDTHEEPWLRDALGSLLVDEPPMPPATVVDDVRRGAVALTAVKRRRTASLAIAAVVLAVAVPVGLVLRAAPNAATPPATSITSAPKVAGVSQEWLDRISPAVTASTAGWVVDWPSSKVTGDVATGLTLDLTLVPASVTGGSQPVVTLPTPPYPQTATLRIELLPAGKGPGAAMASCPAATCPRDLPDRKFPTYLDVVAKAGNGAAFPAGTAILDRSYDAGRFVELVSLPRVSTGSGASDAAVGAVLPYPFAGAFLDAIGEPTASTEGAAFAPPVLDGALVGSGWTVVGSPQALNSSPSYAYLIQPSDGSATASANVIVSAARQGRTGPYLSACTPTTCPGGSKVVMVDGSDPASSYQETISVAGEGLLVPAGSRIVDRAYSGTLVEVVVTPSWTSARDARTPVTATAVLTEGQQDRIVNIIGDPFVAQQNPDAASPRFVGNAEWPAAVVAALPGTATALDGAGVEPDGTSAVVNLDLTRDGVGSYVRVRLDSPVPGTRSPLQDSPCVDTAGGATCVVDHPWTTGVIAGATVETSVIEVSYPENFPGARYAGAYSTRTLVVVRGETVLTILSDSRDTDSSGQWASSTAPALSTEDLLTLGRTMPLPYAMQPAFERPLWGVPELTPRGPAADAPVDIPGCVGDMTKPALQQTCLDAVGTALAQRSLYYAGGSAMTLASVDPAVTDIAVWFQAHVTSAAASFSRDSAAGPHPGTSRAPVVTSWNIGPSTVTYYACMSGTGISVGTKPCAKA